MRDIFEQKLRRRGRGTWLGVMSVARIKLLVRIHHSCIGREGEEHLQLRCTYSNDNDDESVPRECEGSNGMDEPHGRKVLT